MFPSRHLRLIGLLGGVLLLCAASGLAQGQKPLPGEKFTPPAPGERQPDKLKPGDPAPDFTLADPTGQRKTTLSGLRDKKPVVLIFGSCT